MGLTEVETMRKGGKNGEELNKKHLYDPDNHNGVITHLEQDLGMKSQVGLRKHHYDQS